MLNSIFTATATMTEILIMLGTAIALGILNALAFSFRNRQSKSFSLALALLPMVSSIIIFLVNDHLGAGVAVAGAFTLVRFRSVAGTGRETVGIFASMALGLVLGMGYITLAVVIFVLVAAMTMILTGIGFGEKGMEKQVRITVPEDLDYDGLFDDLFDKYTAHRQLERVRTTHMGTLFELSYNVTFPSGNIPKAFIDEIRTRNGNLAVVVCSCGEMESL